MSLKIGDKLICKKTFDKYSCVSYTKGKSYRIDDIKWGIDIINNQNEWCTFHDEEKYDNVDSGYIWHWFYKPHETRSNKMKTII